MRGRVRLSYANVMSTLAVFLLLAGGGALAAVTLKRNSVKSKHIAPNAVKGVDANEASFGKVPSAQSADIANLANVANGVPPDAIGAGEVQDTTRAVNLPVMAFVNETDLAPLDFVASDGSAPDFVRPGNQIAIRWDEDTDGGGGNIADTDRVETNFLVPPDYAAGGSFLLRIYRASSTGTTERLKCAAHVNGTAGAQATTILTNFGFILPETLVPTPGQALYPRCRGGFVLRGR